VIQRSDGQESCSMSSRRSVRQSRKYQTLMNDAIASVKANARVAPTARNLVMRNQRICRVLCADRLRAASLMVWVLLSGSVGLCADASEGTGLQVDVRQCKPGQQNVAFGLGSQTVVVHGIKNDQCVFDYTSEIEGGYQEYHCAVAPSIQWVRPAEYAPSACTKTRSGNVLMEAEAQRRSAAKQASTYDDALRWAIQEKNPRRCDQITARRIIQDYGVSAQEAREQCHAAFAVETSDVRYCLSLRDRPKDTPNLITPRDVCLRELARKLRREDLCQLMPSVKNTPDGPSYMAMCKRGVQEGPKTGPESDQTSFHGP